MPCSHGDCHGSCVMGLRSLGVKAACPTCAATFTLQGAEASFDSGCRLLLHVREGRKSSTSTGAPSSPGRTSCNFTRLLIDAAEQGHSGASFLLGRLHLKGEGFLPSRAEAAKWFLLSGRSGHTGAQSALTNLMLQETNNADTAGPVHSNAAFVSITDSQNIGNDDESDVNRREIQHEVLGWWQQHARNGSALAMHRLGSLHDKGGLSLAPNQTEAAKWFALALAAGH